MTDFDALLASYQANLKKAFGHLNYSYKKVKDMSANVGHLDEEELEVWESFVARFSRASDLYITKYLRTYLRQQDPAFDGTVRDILNQGEKLGFVENVQDWLKIRELRNKAAHDYDDAQLEEHFKETRKLTPIILNVEDKLK